MIGVMTLLITPLWLVPFPCFINAEYSPLSVLFFPFLPPRKRKHWAQGESKKEGEKGQKQRTCYCSLDNSDASILTLTPPARSFASFLFWSPPLFPFGDCLICCLNRFLAPPPLLSYFPFLSFSSLAVTT